MLLNPQIIFMAAHIPDHHFQSVIANTRLAPGSTWLPLRCGYLCSSCPTPRMAAVWNLHGGILDKAVPPSCCCLGKACGAQEARGAVNIPAPACRGCWFTHPIKIQREGEVGTTTCREPLVEIDLEAPPKGMEFLQSARPVNSKHF